MEFLLFYCIFNVFSQKNKNEEGKLLSIYLAHSTPPQFILCRSTKATVMFFVISIVMSQNIKHENENVIVFLLAD